MRILCHVLFFILLFIGVNLITSCSRKTITNTSNVKDSIHVEYKERLVEVPVPGDTVKILTIIECDSITNKPKPIEVKKKSARAKVNLKVNSSGAVTVDCTCDSLKRIVRLADKEIFRLREIIEQKETLKTEYKTRTIHKIATWFMSIVLLVGAGIIILRLKRIL